MTKIPSCLGRCHLNEISSDFLQETVEDFMRKDEESGKTSDNNINTLNYV